MRVATLLVGAGVAAFTVLAVVVPDWHRPGFHGTQMGYRGTQLVQFESRASSSKINTVLPAPQPAAEAGGAKATGQYKNVKVLTDLDAAEFMRLQHAITDWVAPKEGCAFCHDTNDFSSDAKPQKQVARRMLEMTRYVNSAWGSHVNPAGVTCYTCHRGQPVPAEVWWPRTPKPVKPAVDHSEPWNEAADTVSTFFPNNGFAEYYLQDNPIAVQSTTAMRTNDVADYIVVKRVYEMMMQMSLQIGVNCGYCHNSRALQDWSQSTPMRWTGFFALRFIRDLNRNYLLPLAATNPQQRTLAHPTAMPVIPAYQRGQQPGNALLTCATCHYGLPQPLNGANLVKDYPGLVGNAPKAKDADPDGSSAQNAEMVRAAAGETPPPDPNAKPVGAPQ